MDFPYGLPREIVRQGNPEVKGDGGFHCLPVFNQGKLQLHGRPGSGLNRGQRQDNGIIDLGPGRCAHAPGRCFYRRGHPRNSFQPGFQLRIEPQALEFIQQLHLVQSQGGAAFSLLGLGNPLNDCLQKFPFLLPEGFSAGHQQTVDIPGNLQDVGQAVSRGAATVYLQQQAGDGG